MSDIFEYDNLTLEQLLLKALDSRIDTAPLLAEAQRRDRSPVDRLAAVIGHDVGTEWTPVGAIALDDGTHQIAVCIRMTPTPVAASMRFAEHNFSTIVENTEEPMRLEGGSWRDKGRVAG